MRLLILLTVALCAKNPSMELKQGCLNCHIKQKIPSELIYRRYLLYYSSRSKIQSKMLLYLKNPKKEKSIMPSQFFLKFPMKRQIEIKDTHLIDEYLDFFDIKGRLILKN